MGWRHVLFANWPVDPAVVDPHVPDKLTLDTRAGDAWLSIVPFTNVDVRPTWLPAGLGVRLPELNLRTYVRYQDTPGIYFFSLDAAGLLGVVGARLFHNLPYYFARMSLSVDSDRVRFHSRRRHPGARQAEFGAVYEPVDDSNPLPSEDLVQYLTARYRYYTESPSGEIRSAAVEHDPWTLYRARVQFGENTLFAANRFAVPDSDPVYFYSPGVDTIASASRPLD